MLASLIVWAFIILVVLALLSVIATIGKPREPITPGGAVAATIIVGIQLAGLFYLLAQL